MPREGTFKKGLIIVVFHRETKEKEGWKCIKKS